MATFTFNKKTVFYTLDGNPKHDVILLLNGIMMSTKSWEPFVGALTKHHRLLRVDFFDQGQSAKMDTDYTQQIQVDLTRELLDHLNLDKVYVAGISYGGSVALQFAAQHQDRIKKMILFNAVSKTSPWLKAIGDGWNQVAQTRDGLAYYNVAIPLIYSPDFYTKKLDWMENRKKVLIPVFSDPTFLDAMIRLTKSAESHDVNDALASIDVETLVVASEHDYLTPPFEQQYIVDHLPKATLITINDAGHASMYEKPELFTSLLIGFACEHPHYKI
ncbi:MAG: alpha/beta fold hydrolase [Bacillota bacterium]